MEMGVDLRTDVHVDTDPAEACFLGSVLLLQFIHMDACVNLMNFSCSVVFSLRKQTTMYLCVL